MTDGTSVILARMEACMDASQSLLGADSELLKTILERLTPQQSDGPSMGELLTELVAGVGNVNQRTKRILCPSTGTWSRRTPW